MIVLAGDRNPGDPLAVAASVAGKTLVPVAGKAMLARVLEVLQTLRQVERILVVAPDTPGHHQVLAAARAAMADGESRVHWLPPARSPAASVSLALESIPESRRVLLTTGDHPLLTAAMVEELCRAGAQSRADLVLGMVDAQAVLRRFPGSRRTRYRCRGGDWCGTNLFLLLRPQGRRIATIWRDVEQHRKSPWRIARLLGTVNLARFMARRLTLRESLLLLSARLGIAIEAVVLTDPESAVDVDTRDDLALVEDALAGRRHHGPS